MTYSQMQLEIFLQALFIGVILACIYDVIKIFRYAINHKQMFIYLEDGIFWIISTFSVFHVCLVKNDGEIRLYFVLGVFIGMILYFIIVSPFIMSCAEKIIDIVKFIVKLFIEIILTPVKLVYMAFCRPIVKIAEKYLKKILKVLLFYKLCVKIKVMEFLREKQIIANISQRKKEMKKEIKKVKKVKKEGKK